MPSTIHIQILRQSTPDAVPYRPNMNITSFLGVIAAAPTPHWHRIDKLKTLILIIGCLFVSTLARAQTMTPISDGNSLKAACAAAHAEHPNMVTTFSEGQCNGFITGIASTEALLLYGEKAHSSDGSVLPSFCVQDGVTYSQSRAIVEKYLADNPAKLHHNAALLVREALMQAFPCGK